MKIEGQQLSLSGPQKVSYKIQLEIYTMVDKNKLFTVVPLKMVRRLPGKQNHDGNIIVYYPQIPH